MAALSHALVGSGRPASAAQLPVDLCYSAGELGAGTDVASDLVHSLTEVVSRASIGPLSGEFVIAGMLVFYGALVALGVYSYWISHIKKSLPAGHLDA